MLANSMSLLLTKKEAIKWVILNKRTTKVQKHF